MTNASAIIDLSLLDPVLSSYQGRKRDALLPLLHEAQEIYGWLPGPVQEAIGETLRVPLADVHGVIEFYSMLYNVPTPRRVVRLCEDPACYLAGAEEVGRKIETQANGSRHGEIGFEFVPCLGMCDSAPAGLVDTLAAGHVTLDTIDSILSGIADEPVGDVYGEPRWILSRVGRTNPESLESYREHGGYTALIKATKIGPEQVIAEMEESGLLGRGGAMFPVGRKWRFTRAADGHPSRKHIIVNADESEPGTFKDRYLLEGDPFAIIEGATLAGFAVGAENGWIFVRGEYPKSLARVKEAIRQARQAGLLGKDVLGVKGFHFDLQVRKGAGAYICGEETALFEAIEGKRGFPRIKPPFPVTHGLFHQPTAINNVETLATAVAILERGVEVWRSAGSEQSSGTKLFCLSGHVVRPGVYEVPFGLTVAELISLAGGVPGTKPIKGVLLGGAAGTFIGPDSLDFTLDYETARERNIPLGSGVVMVFDETVDLRRILWQVSRFFAHESCGKCFPCQLGTQRQMEILGRLLDGSPANEHDRQALVDIGLTMTETSLCGLGQTAASAVLSALDLWPELMR